MFSGVLAVFFLICFGVVSFVWLLRSDPVARNCLNNLKMSNFDGKFSKLYFAWISPAPFCTILTQNIKWHKKFLCIGIFHYSKDRKLLWSHLVKVEKEWEKHWNWQSYTRWYGLTVLWDTLYMHWACFLYLVAHGLSQWGKTIYIYIWSAIHLWLSKVLANERRYYICNVFSHGPKPWIKYS